MASFYIKRGDTSPALQYTLDPTTNLTGATVVFNMRSSQGAVIRSRGAATIVAPASSGIVKYVWQASDTAEPDTCRAEFEVTFSDGTIETFPNNGYIEVVITNDLG